MKYMLLMYASEVDAPQYTPEEFQVIGRAWYALGKEAEAAGVLVSKNGPCPVTDATTVRVRNED